MNRHRKQAQLRKYQADHKIKKGRGMMGKEHWSKKYFLDVKGMVKIVFRGSKFKNNEKQKKFNFSGMGEYASFKRSNKHCGHQEVNLLCEGIGKRCRGSRFSQINLPNRLVFSLSSVF